MKTIYNFLGVFILGLLFTTGLQSQPGGNAEWEHTDSFYGEFDQSGIMMPYPVSGGSGFTGGVRYNGDDGEWFEYPSGWVNQWFFDGEMILTNYKKVWIYIELWPTNSTGGPGLFDVVVNWSTDLWPDPISPPLPAPFGPIILLEDEVALIGRSASLLDPGAPPNSPPNPIEILNPVIIDTFIIIRNYNPAWISIDVAGINVGFNGEIWHSCEGDNGYHHFEMGDAPEDDGNNNVLAYLDGTIGNFPTCFAGPADHILHWFPPMMYFGTDCDPEIDGNHNLCSPFPYNPANYDYDECYGPVISPSPPPFVDPGLDIPSPWTITGTPGNYNYAACAPPGGTLGQPGGTAIWGQDIDIWVINQRFDGVGYVNVLMDWNQNGQWGEAGEWVLVNYPVIPTPGHVPISTLPNPPLPFQIGPKAGYVWSRFTISERPVDWLQPGGPGEWDGSGPPPEFLFLDGETEDYLLYIEDEQPSPDEIPLSNWAIFLAVGLIVLLTAIIIRRRF